jgi:hypothetical protein
MPYRSALSGLALPHLSDEIALLYTLLNDRFVVFSIIEKATPEITLITLRVI